MIYYYCLYIVVYGVCQVSGFFFSMLNIILETFWNFCLKNIEYLLHFKYSLLTETLGITIDEKPEKSPELFGDSDYG